MSKRVLAWLCLQVLLANSLTMLRAMAQYDQTTVTTAQPGPSPGTFTNDGSAALKQSQAPDNAPGKSILDPLSSSQSLNKTSGSIAPVNQPSGSGQPVLNSSANQHLPADPLGASVIRSQINAALSNPSESPSQPAKSSPNPRPNPATANSPVAATTRTMLYGRIEQIAGTAGAQFPVVLKPLQAQMDPRALSLKGAATQGALRGSLVSAFPFDFSGNWGGNLTVWAMQMAPLCYRIDPEEAKWTATAMRQGLVGQANFNFQRGAGGKVELEPTRIAFQVPMKDTNYQGQIDQLMSSGAMGGQQQAPGMGNFMRQFLGSMAGSMTIPMLLNLGNFQTGGMLTGVSGNQLHEQVLRNTIRQLAPGVIEQQILTTESERNPKTGQVQEGYGESVIRFTKQSEDQFYVQVATVNYTQNREFKRKIILYGTVRKGVVVNDNPSPAGGLGNMLNQPGGGMRLPQMPGMPPGQNPLQNFFQQ